MTGAVSRSLKEGEKVFAFAPFDPQQKPYFISSGFASSKNKTKSKADRKNKNTSKKQFTNLVKKIISSIRSGDFKKIVAARVLSISKPKSFDPLVLFKKLCDQYPGTFVSLTHIPGVGLWLGASPEILVSETSSGLTTYSLAGTKVINDSTGWSAKEIEEQQIVTDFIHKKLHKTVEEKISINQYLFNC